MNKMELEIENKSFDSHPNWGDWGGDHGGWMNDGWSDRWSYDSN